MKKRIYLSPPHMGGHEMKYIEEAFAQNWVAPIGPNVDHFERELAEYLGVKHVAALASGTAAIHLALINLGVGPGDEVLVSSLTFSATVNPILYLGATPVFIDSENQSWNMCPQLLAWAIEDRINNGKKPKAILVVHLYGMVAQMDAILDIANEYEIPVIEDAAESLGSRYDGKHCGTLAQMGIFSFNGNKIITTSGGGALCSDNEKFIQHARFLATQARDNYPWYHHTHVGYNYRMSNIVAGIGRGQLEVIEERVKARRKIFDFYYNLLSNVEGITFPVEASNTFSNRWLTCIILNPEFFKTKTPSGLISLFEENNIEARHIWKPMHTQPVFAHYPAFLNGVSEYIFQNGICLPSGSAMTDEDLERIGIVLKKYLLE